MNKSKFRKIVDQAIKELLSHEHFKNVVSRNWIDCQGNEEALYPYFAEMIRGFQKDLKKIALSLEISQRKE